MYATTASIRKRTWWIATALLAITLMIGLNAQSVAAQATPVPTDPVVVDPTTCGHFETQKDAQEALEYGNLEHREFLDADGDGIACEDRWGEIDGGPVVIDWMTCGHFENQTDAQDALDDGDLKHPEFLDGDGDGIACEDVFDEVEEGPVVVDPTSCGHFVSQDSAQEAFDSGDLPDPENLDADGDGIVCEFRWGEVETDDSESITNGEIVALPNTGTGSAAGGDTSALLIAGLLLVSIAGALQLRTQRLG